MCLREKLHWLESILEIRKAHMVLLPGVREGWGLVVTESNSMGTLVEAHNFHGLRGSQHCYEK